MQEGSELGPSCLFLGHQQTEEAAGKNLVILQKRVAGISESTLERFLLRARRIAGLRGTVNVLVTSSASLRSLNREFRGKNKATDVLSFPATLPANEHSRRPGLAGEIAISADIALQNAIRLGHAPAEEIKILMLHGILHLAGMDHERDNGEMARKEATLRRTLGLPASLIERSARDPVKSRRRNSSSATGSRRTA